MRAGDINHISDCFLICLAEAIIQFRGSPLDLNLRRHLEIRCACGFLKQFIEVDVGEVLLHDADIINFAQFGDQHTHIPLRRFTDLVVGDTVRLGLFRRQIDLDNRNLGHLELNRGLKPRMPGYDHAVLIDENRLIKAEGLDALLQRLNRRLIRPGIPPIRLDRSDRSHLHLHSVLPISCG